MILEAVTVIVDNNESSQHGDYAPTRYEAQVDAVSLIFSAFTQAKLVSTGSTGPEVLVTSIVNHGKILEALHHIQTSIRGEGHLATAIQIACVRFP